MICEYCKNSFSNKSNLNLHQKTAKYCLKIQKKELFDQYKCDGCKKKFRRLQYYNNHIKKCVTISILNNSDEKITILKNDVIKYKAQYQTLIDEKQILISKYDNLHQGYKKEIDDIHKEYKKEIQHLHQEYKKEINVLQDKLENIAIQTAKKPTTATYNNRNQINTIIQNLGVTTDNDFKDNAHHLTIDHLKEGVNGYVNYALKYPLKDKLTCVDYSRRKVKYKDENGVQTDPEMNKLTKLLFSSIADKNKDLALSYVNQLSNEINDDERMKIIAEMSQLMVDVNESARGNKTDFTHDFVRKVCSKTVF
jgi:gas vesicle protein